MPRPINASGAGRHSITQLLQHLFFHSYDGFFVIHQQYGFRTTLDGFCGLIFFLLTFNSILLIKIRDIVNPDPSFFLRYVECVLI